MRRSEIMAESKAVANQAKSIVDSIQTQLEGRLVESMVAALGTKEQANKFQVAAFNAIRRNDKLQRCTIGSISMAIAKSAEAGLPADGRLAALVPYKDECQYQLMYEGVLELAYAYCDRFLGAQSEIVYENDEFVFELGLTPKCMHKPCLTGRGKPTGCYNIIRIRDADPLLCFMSAEELDAHAKHYSKALKFKMSTPWSDELGKFGMWKKTVFLRNSHWMPKGSIDSKLNKALQVEYDREPVKVDSEVVPQTPRDLDEWAEKDAAEESVKAELVQDENVPDDDDDIPL